MIDPEEPFLKVWQAQNDYNNKIKDIDGNYDKEDWTKTYLLGLVSEVDEMLRAINWKRHRKTGNEVNRSNIAYELADLTKYIFSLWQLWDFSVYDMLRYVDYKNDMLDILLQQEFSSIPENMNVLILDIDGTLGDWRKEFLKWLDGKGLGLDFYPYDETKSLNLDTLLRMEYQDYFKLKEEFEASGGYAKISPYWDAVGTVLSLQKAGVFLIVYTARPNSDHHRIWTDTWLWLKSYNIIPDQFYLGHESRVLLAKKLSSNHKVIMFEDDPGLIQRAVHSGIRVFARRQPYNEGISHENVTFVESYEELPIETYFERGE